MSEETKKSLIKFDDHEKLIDVASFISSAVPWIGGPVSNVLGGISTSRKIARINELLHGLAEDLTGFKSDVSEKYVKTEDFEDLLEQTLRRASEERNEEKRKILKSFLSEAVKSPGESYDDQLRILRLLENIYGDHIIILKALLADPGNVSGITGSPINTLRSRTNMPNERIEELVNQLNDLRVTNLQSLKVMMTPQGAADLRGSVTDIGKRFIKYLES